MQPRKHLLAMCSVLLMAALLAACAAPAAAPTTIPAPPTDTPVPPEAAQDPAAVAQAWMNAISDGDVDAALALVTDDVSFRFGGEGGIGPTMMGGHLNWWAGIDTKYHIFDCQTDDAEASCNVDLVDGCIAVMGYPDGLPMQIKFVVEQDGKIGEISAPTVGPEWDDYWNQVSLGTAWMQAHRAEELAKRDWSREYGPTQLKMCQDFAIAKQTQAPATAKAAQDFVDALNSGDADAALALLTDEAKFGMLNDKAEGADQLRSMFDWLAGKETQFQISDCEWQGISTQCAVSVVDGCIAASGAADGLHGKMTFYSEEDGTLRQVNVAPSAAKRKEYQTWLEAETVWASANRADELAQAEGYSQEAGAMAVRLCQEYATAAKTPTSTPVAPSATGMEVFVRGAPIRLPVGLAVGPDDNLYVGSQWVRSLPVLNPETGEILKSFGPEDGVDIPADLAFGPDGSLYASMYPGFEGDSVMRMAPDGTVTSMALPPIIWPVMTTKDGRLFAALLLENDLIVELDPDFKAPQREVVSDGNFIHMREGPDGMIYAIRWFDGEIVRFDPDAPDKVEMVATGLTLPFNLAFDSTGRLYVIVGVDESTDAVIRLDLATGDSEILATMHNMLYGLAIDSKDRIFVSSASDGTIFEVLPEGEIRIVSPGGAILPGDVEVIARPDGESLFLADWESWQEYDTATGEMINTRYSNWWPGTLVGPDTIAPFGNYLLLASSENQQIQIWDPVQQKEVLLIDDPGVNNAIGFDDAIVATSHETKDVVRIDPKDPDQRTVLASGLEYPLGLAVDAGNLYIGDFLAGQILQVAADGGTLDPPKLVVEGLQGPEGLALTGDGRLLVVESGADRLSLVDLSSGEVTPLATNLGIMRDIPRSRPLHYFFNGVDVSPSGMVYVTADDANAIYRIPLPKPAVKLDDATAAKIETLVAEIMASGQVPGAAVGIVKDGELVYAKGFGVTELGSDQPVTADSIFHMGSVAKTATAVAIMQLVEAGKIDLDAPVTEYLPDFTLADADLSEVTIRRLLSHTAGMPDPIDWLVEYQDENLRSDDAALDDYVRSLGDQSLTYQPGEDWAYSNTGFDILGDVVATVSGQSFEDYLQANVLTPLGMANSSYLLSDLDPAQLATPHMYDEDGNANTLDFYPYTRAHAPSGAFYSSINDMARFAIANMNQGELDGTRVLPASAYEEMWAPQAASPWAEMFGPQVASYGLGWWVGDFNDHRIIGNYGTEFGFQSHMALFPDDGMAVIALVNLFDPEAGQFYALQIGDAVEAELLGVEVPAQ